MVIQQADKAIPSQLVVAGAESKPEHRPQLPTNQHMGESSGTSKQ